MKITKKIILVISIFFIIFNLLITISNLSNQNNFFITGQAGTTQTGTTLVNVTGVVSITLTTDTVNFGSGYVNISADSCNMNTIDGLVSGCVGFSEPASGFILENDGNVNVSVTANSTTAAEFIGGTNPQYRLDSADSEASSCSSELLDRYYEFTGSPQTVCSNLGFIGTADTIEIDIEVTIPDDANVGFRDTNVTFTATEV